MDRPADRSQERYDIDTEAVMFATGEAFDIAAVGAANQPWWNRTLCEVNDTWMRLGVLEGDFHWHKHAGWRCWALAPPAISPSAQRAHHHPTLLHRGGGLS